MATNVDRATAAGIKPHLSNCIMGAAHPAQKYQYAGSPLKSKWRMQRDTEWAYGRDRGPDSWWVYYPAAGGSHQSPINIDPEEAEYDSDLATYPLQVRYSDYCSKQLVNTGNSCQVNIGDKSSYITGGPLGVNKYRLHQFHFHWGDTDDCGSEHLVNNKAYSAELHLVHWNCDKYSSFSEAAENPDGLAVIAVFIEKGDPNFNLSFIVDHLSSVRYKNDTLSFSGTLYNPVVLVPDDLDKYWVYQGSLTTPPCTECVTWIIFFEPITASEVQLNQFRQLRSHMRDEKAFLDEHGGFIRKNYRPVQERGNRKIRTMQHNFLTNKDIDEQFHKQGMFTGHREIKCQFNRQGISIDDPSGRMCSF